jgi:hypothetical protein
MGSPPKHSACRFSAELTHASRIQIVPRFQAALAILLEAYDYARQLLRPAWDFAVEIRCLRAAGLTHSDLRWLACQELVEHAEELTRAGSGSRVFSSIGPLTFTKRTCFVLTETGAALARPGSAAGPSAQQPSPSIEVASPSLVPQWDKERQELRLGRLIVKQFKVPAPNQEMVLAAFEEEHWPPRIDDPLPPHADQDPKRRVHDTINTLNRHQKNPLIHFLGDGTGEGIRWQLSVSQPDSGQSS